MADAAVQPANLGQEQKDNLTIKQEQARGSAFGPVALFVFAACAVGLPFGGLLPFSTIAAVWPGTNLVIVLAVALAISLVHAYTFAAIGSIGQSPSSDWQLSGRGRKTSLEFASSWALAIFLALGSGVVIGSLLSEVVPAFARGLSFLFGDRTLANNISAFGTQEGLVLYGTFIVLLIFLLLFIPPKITGRIMLIGLVLTGTAWFVVCFQLAFATPQAFSTAWDAVMGSGAFTAILNEALGAGFQPVSSLQTMLSVGVAIGLAVLPGYFFPAYFSSEVNTPQKNLLRSSVLALLCCGGLLLAGVFLAQRVIPLVWLSAQAVLSQQTQYQMSTLSWLPFYAAVLRPDPILFWAVGIGWVTGIVSFALTLAYTASRIVESWADGGFLPASVQFIHPELKSPLIAVLLASILVEAGLVLFALGFDAKFWFPLAIASSQVIPVLALVRLPFRQPDLFARSPMLVNRKIGPLPLVSLAGILSLAFLVITIVYFLATPELGGLPGGGALAFVIIFIIGIIWYYGSRPYHGQAVEKQEIQSES